MQKKQFIKLSCFYINLLRLYIIMVSEHVVTAGG